jgi:glycosyltransferase involved in cell wall biosynthesis
MADLTLVVPGTLETPTGGYVYDRRIVAGLRSRGWSIDVALVDDSFPRPTADARAQAARTLAGIPAGSSVLVDGLAFGALPGEIEREARRLRLLALIHHPLARETGLESNVAARLEASERRALAAVARVVVTSRQTAEGLADYGVPSERISIVEPGTDPAPLARGSAGGVVELLCVATLIPRKGHAILLDALQTLAHLPWRLTCVGSASRDRDTATRLCELTRARGWTDRVELAGEVGHDLVDAHYDRAHVFVLPTLYEGYGMVVAEALARGLPVVSTACGGIPDLVDKSSGLIVPPGDVDALAAALSRVVGDAAFRGALKAGAAAARERLPTWDDAAARMEAALGGRR